MAHQAGEPYALCGNPWASSLCMRRGRLKAEGWCYQLPGLSAHQGLENSVGHEQVVEVLLHLHVACGAAVQVQQGSIAARGKPRGLRLPSPAGWPPIQCMGWGQGGKAGRKGGEGASGGAPPADALRLSPSTCIGSTELAS